jgi:hypothetical protein
MFVDIETGRRVGFIKLGGVNVWCGMGGVKEQRRKSREPAKKGVWMGGSRVTVGSVPIG